MALHARWVFVGGEAMVVVDGGSGIFQRPLVGFRFPLTMICPFLNTLRLYFPNSAMQLSSQSFPIDISEPAFRLSRMCPVCACLERAVERGMVTWWLACMDVPKADRTVGPVDVAWIVVHVSMSDGLM